MTNDRTPHRRKAYRRQGLAMVLAAALVSIASPAMAECSVGVVQGLNPNGDGFLAVRSGASSKRRQINSLFNGDLIAVCGSKGSWRRIRFGGDGCAAGNPPGYCQKGWVFGKYVSIIAG